MRAGSLYNTQTIVAVGSTLGPSARLIVRVSGEQAFDLLATLKLSCPIQHPSALHTRAALGKGIVVPAWLYTFQRPRSYTGENLIELHLPGNPILANLAIAKLMAAGARLAEPGEFTARAFFNGRLDLPQAEGVAAAVAAQSQDHLHAARRLMSGELSIRLASIMETGAQSLAVVEADIDFSDSDIPTFDSRALDTRIAGSRDELRSLLRDSGRFEGIRPEPTIVLIGQPNAGKSTLFNALCGHARAVVSNVAGTTRDALIEPIILPSGMARLIDLAGIDAVETTCDSSDPTSSINHQMRQKALEHLSRASVVVLVRDPSQSKTIDPPCTPDLQIITKADLHNFPQSTHDVLHVSALHGIGIDDLRARLDRLAFTSGAGAWSIILNGRHVEEISAAELLLEQARSHLQRNSIELVAADLRQALNHLGQVLGVLSPDDILGRVFSTFCIGK